MEKMCMSCGTLKSYEQPGVQTYFSRSERLLERGHGVAQNRILEVFQTTLSVRAVLDSSTIDGDRYRSSTHGPNANLSLQQPTKARIHTSILFHAIICNASVPVQASKSHKSC